MLRNITLPIGVRCCHWLRPCCYTTVQPLLLTNTHLGTPLHQRKQLGIISAQDMVWPCCIAEVVAMGLRKLADISAAVALMWSECSFPLLTAGLCAGCANPQCNMCGHNNSLSSEVTGNTCIWSPLELKMMRKTGWPGASAKPGIGMNMVPALDTLMLSILFGRSSFNKTQSSACHPLP